MNPYRRRILKAATIAALGARAAGAAAAATAAPRALGYLPWWMAEAWRDMPLAQLDRLVLFEVAVHADGGVDDNDWEKRAPDIAAFARTKAIAIDIAIALHGEAAFNRVFLDPGARRRLAQECARWLSRPPLRAPAPSRTVP